MVKRWLEDPLIGAMTERRGVHLTGARQCGKTTLAESLQFPRLRRYTFDYAATRNTAAGDPAAFVRHDPGETLVIDEVQKVPDILESIKIILDHDNTPGQYLLTGSANLRFVKAVRESLAGRLRTLRLRTFAQGEILGGKGDFLEKAFARDFAHQYPDMSKRDVIHEAFLGGYPEARGLSDRERVHWYVDYLNDLLLRDIQDITEIRKLGALRKMSDWLLAYSSKFFPMEDLCRAAQIRMETATSYLLALQAVYIVDGIEPWSDSDYKKLGKRTKYYVSDPGLMANTLGWDEESVYLDDDRSGKLVESWAYHEIAPLCDKAGNGRLLQYRDSDKREIDLLVKREDGALLGIEVKSGSLVGKEDFTHLKWFNRTFAPEHFTGLVLYSGSDLLSFGDNLYAVPFSALAH